MKITKLLNFFLLFAVLTVFVLSGCGKSEKEAKITSGEKPSDVKGNKTLVVDVNESIVKWVGKKVTGQHDGTVKLLNGEILMDSDKPVSGKFDIDMNSIVVLDITDPETNGKLLAHLKSDDFFSVEKNPVSKFEITSIENLSDATVPEMNYNIKGNLTIKGITKGIIFPAHIKYENGKLTALADFDIDRTEWDIKYSSGKFFQNLGDKMINDNFTLKLNITAK